MKRIVGFTLALLLAGLVFLPRARAAAVVFQVPFTYQTRLTAGRSYSFTFQLYDRASGGTRLWDETKSLRVAPDRTISHLLGSRKRLPWYQFSRQMWVQVSANGRALTPRAKLRAVPYALYSFAAGNVSTPGLYNAAVGTGALGKNKTGYSNSALGAFALGSNLRGRLNTAVGIRALAANVSGGWNTAVGESALYSNRAMRNTAAGAAALYRTLGSNNTALGYHAGFGDSGGLNNTYLGYNAQPASGALTNATAVGANATVGVSNALVLGDLSTTVGIGTSTPDTAYKLYVAGSAYKTTGTSWTSTSDAHLKRNIAPLEGALDKLLALRGVRFEWADPARAAQAPGVQMGMIAQEVERVFPQWVGTDREGYRNLTPNGFEALTVEALREINSRLAAENARLRAEDAAIRGLIEGLAAQLADLKKEVAGARTAALPALER